MPQHMNKPPPIVNSRHAAARVVGTWLKTGEFPDRLMESVERDRAFVMEVAYGTIRLWRALDWIRGRLAERKPRRELEAFVLIGLYQLLFMDHVEAYAAVSETVEAAKRTLGPKAGGLVNALLRRAQAERDPLFQSLEKQPLAVRLSHPDLLVARWTAQFDADRARRLCEWNNTRSDVILCANLMRTDGRALHEALRSAGVAAEPHPFAPDRFFTLPRGARVRDLPGYAEGWFTIQDPATSISVELLDPQPGERVLDACAAPGGKTALLAERLRGEGELVAMDSSKERMEPLRENLARLGLQWVKVVEGDAGRAGGDAGTFRAILLDAPCTNTGVIRRRPDVRWRFSRNHLQRACARQVSLLDGVASRVEPGGRLVYSTCSLEPEENEEQVERWVSRHSEFQLVRECRLFPPGTQTDGAYAALLVKS